jgi:hypothetical protein
MLRRMPLVSMIRCVGSLMFSSRSEVFANAVDSKTFDAGRSTSGNSAALSKLSSVHRSLYDLG